MTVIDLLVPGLFGPLPAEPRAVVQRLPGLERLLARADAVPFGIEGTDAALLALAGLDFADSADCPIGALSLLGEGIDPGNGCWLRADPVHLRADLNRLLIFDLVACPPTGEQAAALVDLFNAHFADRGLRLMAPHPGRWYLGLDECPAVRTRSLETVVGRSPDEGMPSGDDAALWRALLNEAQMLFHAAPVNTERESCGLPSVNGIWVHGAGRLPAALSPRADAFFGDDPVLRGLARLAGAPACPVPVRAEELFGAGEHSLVLWAGLQGPVLSGDAQGWAKALGGLEAFLGRLDRGLVRAPGVQLRICPANGGLRLVDGRRARRFWRRRRTMDWWLKHC